MELKPLIIDTINELDAQGKGVAIDYFKPFIPDITRQKLSAWKKNGKFPFEIAEAVFANEFNDDGEQIQPEPTRPNQAMIEPAAPIAAEPEFEADIPEGAEIDDQNLDGSLASDTAPAGNGYPMRAGAGVMGRQQDIRVRPARERGTTSINPVQKPPPIDARTVASVMEAMQQQGWQPPVNRAPGTATRTPAAGVPRKRFIGRNWNQPRRPAPTR